MDAPAQTAKPAVPAGRDPGGVAIAVIGSGIDYTIPNIARRLARDGEGEFIAWDANDNGNRPLDGGEKTLPEPGHWSDTIVTMVVLTDAPDARLVQARVPWYDAAATARAIGFVAKSPARVVLLLRCCKLPDDWALVRDAAAKFPDLLFILPADARRPVDNAAAELKTTGGAMPANVLVVSCIEESGARCPAAYASAALVDVAAPGAARYVTLSDTGAIGTAGVRAAAAIATALAAKLVAAEPGLRGAALKSRLIARARPAGTTAAIATRHGILIPDAP